MWFGLGQQRLSRLPAGWGGGDRPDGERGGVPASSSRTSGLLKKRGYKKVLPLGVQKRRSSFTVKTSAPSRSLCESSVPRGDLSRTRGLVTVLACSAHTWGGRLEERSLRCWWPLHSVLPTSSLLPDFIFKHHWKNVHCYSMDSPRQ